MKIRFLTVLVLVGALVTGYAQKAYQLPNLPTLNSNSLFFTTTDAAGGGSRHTSYGQLATQLATNQPTGTLTNNITGSAATATTATNLFDPSANQFLGTYFRQGDETIYVTRGTIQAQRAIVSQVTSPASASFRDGAPFYLNRRYYVAHTLNSFNETNKFGIIVSDDLVNWTTHLIFDCRAASNYFAGTPAVREVWAPKWFTDSDGSNYITVSISTNVGAGGMRAFVTSATDNTLTNWTPLIMLTNSLVFDNYDGVVVKSNAQYQFWTRLSSSYIEVHTASNIYGPWTAYKTGNWAGWGSGYEGMSVQRYGNGDWFCILSDGAAGKQYYTTTTNDNFSGWETPKPRHDSLNFMNGGLVEIPGRDIDGQMAYIYPGGSNATSGVRYTIGANKENESFSLYVRGGTDSSVALGGPANNFIVSDPEGVGADFYLVRRPLNAELLMHNNGSDNNMDFFGSITATNGTISTGGFVSTNIANVVNVALSPWGNNDTGIEFPSINEVGMINNGLRAFLASQGNVFMAGGMYVFVPAWGSGGDVAFQRDSAGVIQFNSGSGTPGDLRDIKVRTVTATNQVFATNYLASNFAPIPGYLKLVVSNNVLYAVTNIKTNVVSTFAP